MEKLSVKRAAKVSLIFLVTTMLLLSGIVPNISVQPASAFTPVPAPLNGLFGPSIYKLVVHVNGADKGDVSPYYHRYVAGYAENGYDQVLYNQDHNLLSITSEEPYNGGFESMGAWNVEKSSTISGTYIAEQSSAKFQGGSYSLHDKAVVSGATFGSSGMYQDMLWENGAVAANLNLKFAIYPVTLQDTTSSPDSLVVVQIHFNHYDSASTVPNMFLVLQDDASESLSAGTSFVNDTNNVYFTLNRQTPLQFGVWNNFSVDITSLLVKYFGQLKAHNLKVNGIHIAAYSRSNAVSEFYADNVKLTSSNTDATTYAALSNVVKAYDSPSLRMVPGEKLDLPINLLYFNIDTYFRPTGGSTSAIIPTIDAIHARGDYAFVSKPTNENRFVTNLKTLLPPIDGIAAYSTRNNGPKGFSMDIWDYLLTRGVLAPGIAEEHPMSTKDVDYSATYAPTQFVFTPNNDVPTSVEALAQGRSYVEWGYIRPTMPVFFSAENSQVAMGKFPIYVDTSRSTASLKVDLQNIHVNAKTLKLIRNGSVISSTSIAGLTSYSNTFTPSLPDKSDYFRLEIQDVNGSILAFSNPIIYVKKTLSPDIWLALSPSLQYGSAFSYIDSISYGSNTLSFTAHSKDTITVTTKVYTSKAPVSVSGSQSWNYDSNTKILSINSKGTSAISVAFSNDTPTTGTLSVTTTPVNGPVFVDGASWGTAPVSKSISAGSHTVSFGAVAGYTTPASTTVSVTAGQTTSVTGTYVKLPSGNSTGTYMLSFQGYDYNNKGEVSVLVNNQEVAALPTSWASQNKEVFVDFSLDITSYVVDGANTLTFKQNMYSSGVRNVVITNDASTIYSNSTYYSLQAGSSRPSVTYKFTTSTPPPTTGTLSVTTTPVNGPVFVDGASWGMAPVSKSISAGSHTVSFGAVSGYTTPASKTVSVTAGQTTSVTGTYTPISSSNGTLTVKTTPVNGEVFVDGISWGIAPVTKSLAAGYHTVSFGPVPGYTKPADISGTLNAGQSVTVTGTYTPITSGNGTLSVTTTPVNGPVFVDGVSWGTAPVSRSIAAGSHTVSYGAVSGYTTPPSTTVSVTAGQTTSVTGTYTPISSGTLTVKTTPVNGEVFVDGVSWGIAPVTRSLAAGYHTVSFGPVPGYTKPADISGTLNAGQSVTVTGTYTPSGGSPTYTLSFLGYDYDNKGEVSILVNNQLVTSLPTVESAQNNDVWKSFSLDITKYVVTGSNTITFKQNLYSSAVKDVQVTESSNVLLNDTTPHNLWTGGTSTVTYTFSTNTAPPPPPSQGTLSVTTTPVNGQVFVDGVSWGVAPVSKTVAAGSHTVSFGAVPGYSTPESTTVTVTAGSTTSVTGTYTPISPPPASPLRVSGSRIVDAGGVEFRMVGLSYGQFPQAYWLSPRNYTQEAINIRKDGFNAVRLVVQWGALETSSSASVFTYNEANFTDVLKMINSLTDQGLYVIIKLHTDGEPRYQYSNLKKFLGDQYCNKDPDVGNAYDTKLGDRFYSQSSAANSTGPFAHFTRMWEKLADATKDNNRVVGYDLLNEPWTCGTKTASQAVPIRDQWTTRVGELIADLRSKGSSKIMFYEPAPMWWRYGDKYQGLTFTKQSDSNVVYSWHWYEGTESAGNKHACAELSSLEALTKLWGDTYFDAYPTCKQEGVYLKQAQDANPNIPFDIGEFGNIYTNKEGDTDQTWIRNSIRLFQDMKVTGYFYWASQTTGTWVKDMQDSLPWTETN